MSDVASLPPESLPAHEQVRALRRRRGETGARFGALIGLSASKVSEIETGKYVPTPEVALAIEELSGGAIDAARLNDLVARARGLRQAQPERGSDDVHASAPSTEAEPAS